MKSSSVSCWAQIGGLCYSPKPGRRDAPAAAPPRLAPRPPEEDEEAEASPPGGGGPKARVAAPPARPGRGDGLDPSEAWVSAAEAEQIREMWAALSGEERAELEAAPEYVRHDLMLCRFLRGHGRRVEGALQALRRHLRYRREHAALLAQVQGMLRPDMEDFDETVFQSKYPRLQEEMHMVQLPGSRGTNRGLPVSLLPLGLMRLEAFGALAEEEVLGWFICMCEMRALCTHNQSVRESRMVKVVEVRDCNGFSWSQLYAATAVLRQLRAIMTVATFYPEILAGCLLFNLQPRLRSIRLLKSLIPKELAKKLLFADRGDWSTCVCSSLGLSTAALDTWAKYIERHRADPRDRQWQLVTHECPQAVRSLRVSAGQTFAWRLRCLSRGAPDSAVQVRVRFFADGPDVPAMAEAAGAERVTCTAQEAADRRGVFTADASGTALLEIELAERGPVIVHASVTRAGFEEGQPEAEASHGLPSLPPPEDDRCVGIHQGLVQVSPDWLWFFAGALTAACLMLLGRYVELALAFASVS